MAQLPNRKWEAFAIALAGGAPLRSSFVAAGYKDSYSAPYNASRLRNHPKVRERINELLAEFRDTSFVKMEWIQSELVRIIDGKAPAKVKIDERGRRFEEIDRLGALNSLAKTLGIADVETNVNVGVAVANGVVTDADRVKALEAFISEIRDEPQLLPSGDDLAFAESIIRR